MASVYITDEPTLFLNVDADAVGRSRGFVTVDSNLLGAGNFLSSPNSDPTSDDGRDGEFWWRKDTNTLFGPKENGSWPAGVPIGTQGGSPITAGCDSIGTSTTTRYLPPWFDDGMAPTVEIQWAMPRPGTLQRMRVRHRAGAGNGGLIDYVARRNGADTLLKVSIISTATAGDNLVEAQTYAAGDLFSLAVQKAASIGSSPQDITVSFEYV